MTLAQFRKRASELSGGTSPDPVRNLVFEALKDVPAGATLIDFGAGKGELLARLHDSGRFGELSGIDLYGRPDSLPPAVRWHEQDLNEPVSLGREFDVAVCSETIEHLENPRHVFRTLHNLLKRGGILVLTMPNQECIRSYAGLLVGGHFTHFLGASYPAHITALLRMDLVRMCAETGFGPPAFSFSNSGGLPKLPAFTWQTLSAGLLKGRLFSDNLLMVTRNLE